MLGDGDMRAPKEFATGRGKRLGGFFQPAAQPVINDNRREQGLLRWLQLSEILRRETVATFSVEIIWTNRSSEGAWEALFATLERDSLVILSLCRASKLLPGKPLGLPAVPRHPGLM